MSEILTTLALRPGLHVVDRDDRRHAEHVVAAVTHPGPQCYCVAMTDGTVVDCGARHTWLDVTA